MQTYADAHLHDLLQSAFPFHIALDEQLEVLGLGRALGKLGLGLQPGARLEDFFRIVTPPLPMNHAAILEQAGTVFFLRCHDDRVTLKGQMTPLQSHWGEVLLFLGSPVLRDMKEINRLNLRLSDFALHDSTVDYLIFLQTQDNVLRDTRRMADQLLEETKERRGAQLALEETNLRLEETVRQRTEALSRSNNKLAGFIQQLRSCNQDLYRLNAAGERLHGCQRLEDALPVVVDGIQELFPSSTGLLACSDDDSETFRVRVRWGEGEHRLPDVFVLEDCPALRDDRIFNYGLEGKQGCPELERTPQTASFCRPLKVGEVVLGLLHLHYPLQIHGLEDPREMMQSRQLLAATLAEHVGLALANLRMRERLEAQAIRDPLTGLYNRRHMEAFLERELERAKREDDGRLGLVLLDVDHFKAFNDNHGHQAGDAVLSQLAGVLANQVRKGDVACRFGGEEFLLILAGASLDITRQRAEQVRAAVAGHCVVHKDSRLGAVTISAGAAAFPHHGDDVASLLRVVDEALYEAKRQGRNRVVSAAI